MKHTVFDLGLIIFLKDKKKKLVMHIKQKIISIQGGGR